MFELILLAIYTLLVLLVVPLEKIGKIQTTVRKKVKSWTDKIGD